MSGPETCLFLVEEGEEAAALRRIVAAWPAAEGKLDRRAGLTGMKGPRCIPLAERLLDLGLLLPNGEVDEWAGKALRSYVKNKLGM